MNFILKIWRQAGPNAKGFFEEHRMENVSQDWSFLEMLDLLNERLIAEDKEPVAFDHDCREGICGMCSLVINGVPHGPQRQTTTCQLHMRHFKDGEAVTIEPFRCRAFPIIKDLMVDRTALEAIMLAGGYISARTGGAPEANATPVPKKTAESSLDAASCIGCGACVAACPNASAMLFTGAKISQLNLLPQGQPEKHRRALAMVEAMDRQNFGNCANAGECAAVCPKGVSLDFIAMMNRNYGAASLKNIICEA